MDDKITKQLLQPHYPQDQILLQDDEVKVIIMPCDAEFNDGMQIHITVDANDYCGEVYLLDHQLDKICSAYQAAKTAYKQSLQLSNKLHQEYRNTLEEAGIPF